MGSSLHARAAAEALEPGGAFDARNLLVRLCKCKLSLKMCQFPASGDTLSAFGHRPASPYPRVHFGLSHAGVHGIARSALRAGPRGRDRNAFPLVADCGEAFGSPSGSALRPFPCRRARNRAKCTPTRDGVPSGESVPANSMHAMHEIYGYELIRLHRPSSFSADQVIIV